MQDLARHSTPTLTVNRYGHASAAEKQAAIADLPQLTPFDDTAKLDSTGTDDENAASCWPTYCPSRPDSSRLTATQTDDGKIVASTTQESRMVLSEALRRVESHTTDDHVPSIVESS